MGTALQERRRVMEAALAAHDLEVSGRGYHGGSSFWMRAPNQVDTDALARRLNKKGVLIEPGRAFFAGDVKPANYYRLAYSSVPTTRIAEGVEIIARDIREMS